MNSHRDKPGAVVINALEQPMNTAFKVAPNGFYHSTIVFNPTDVCFLPPDFVIEFFLRNPDDSSVAVDDEIAPYAIVNMPCYDAPCCGEGHLMRLSTLCTNSVTGYYDSWSCDHCGKSQSTARWWCNLCSADYCFDCNQRAPKPESPLIFHSLPESLTIPQPEFWCRYRMLQKCSQSLEDALKCNSVWNCALGSRCLCCPQPADSNELVIKEKPNLVYSAYRSFDTAAAVARTRNKLVVESEHPYGNDLDQIKCVDVQKLLVRPTDSWKVAVYFDKESKTEANNDYVSFWNLDVNDPIFPEGCHPQCSGSHNMTISTKCTELPGYYQYYNCDLCGSSDGGPRMWCAECGYDMCFNCAGFVQYSSRISGREFSQYTAAEPLIIEQTGPYSKIFVRFVTDSSVVGTLIGILFMAPFFMFLYSVVVV